MLPYIKLFTDTASTVDLLSDDEAGRLFKAVLHYANKQEVELPGRESLVFSMLKTQIDRDTVAYEEFCEKQRVNGLKGGRPRKPVVYADNPENPQDNDNNPNNPQVCANNPENPLVILRNLKSQDKEKDKEEEEEKNKRRFTPPSFEEVSEYCEERGNNVDPEAFIDFYTSKGWKVGNQSMKDWKAAVRTWEKRDNRRKTEQDDDLPDMGTVIF